MTTDATTTPHAVSTKTCGLCPWVGTTDPADGHAGALDETLAHIDRAHPGTNSLAYVRTHWSCAPADPAALRARLAARTPDPTPWAAATLDECTCPVPLPNPWAGSKS